MSSEKPFTLYGGKAGPNPWKVVIILNELNLEYNYILIDARAGENKEEKFLKINPNGRVPALIDHSNNNFTVWESGAIIQYLVAKYDTKKLLHTGTFEQDTLANQWMMFQMSGQGPYFGQYAWFAMFHHEKLPSAVERYSKEAERVLGVLELALKDHEYLTGDQISYADLAFIPWNSTATGMFEGTKDKYTAGEWPLLKKWMEKMNARESVVKMTKMKADLMAEK